MSRLRLLSLTALAAALVAPGLSHCGPEPVGVDDCRAIESARCDAAVACGTVEDAEACRRFYRDHCLHGFAAPDTPGGAQVDRCVQAIQQAGECAADDTTHSISDCSDDADGIELVRGATLKTVCDVVRQPEQTTACEFLSKQPEESAGGAGGDPGD